MSITTEPVVTARPCSTCVHQVRHRGERHCVRPLRHDASSLYMHTALMFSETCENERSHGKWLSMALQLCGRAGRYWRSRT